MIQLYTVLIRLRRNRAGHTAGLLGQHINVFHLNDLAKVLAFHRWHEGGSGNDVICDSNRNTF